MPCIAYVSKRLGASALQVVEQANEIIADYRAQGYELTLRQLYYQFVSRGLLPNTPKDYKRLGDIVSDGRLAGLIDWLAIVDRTRNLRSLAHWRSPAEIVEACAAQFRVDKWARQPAYVEVWVEKEALAGVVERACTPLDVPFFCCRGYTSQSEMWAAAQRLREQEETRSGQVVVLHFGDHDPSGVDMSRDIADRLALFGSRVSVRRIALTMPQIRRYNPPPNPAKLTDSRATSYVREFGDDSWELDALEPSVIGALIEREVLALRDDAAWRDALKDEREGRARLREAAESM